MAGWFPGWPGPIFAGGRPRIPTVTLPVMPHLPMHPGGPAAAAASPLSGLAAYGIPIAQTAGGRFCLQAPPTEEGPAVMLPPELPGMPGMPTPPDELMTGGPVGGGLFRAIAPVAPFSPGNQVGQIKQSAQDYTP